GSSLIIQDGWTGPAPTTTLPAVSRLPMGTSKSISGETRARPRCPAPTIKTWTGCGSEIIPAGFGDPGSTRMNTPNHQKTFWAVWLLIGAMAWQMGVAQDYFLFTSFRGNGEDGLHLAFSTNGYDWQALSNDRSFLKPAVGAGLMRDPCLVAGPGGAFHLVW